MAIEIVLCERSAIDQHRSNELNIVSNSSNRKNISDIRKILKKFTIKRWFNSCIKSRKMIGFAIFLFISLSMTIGILTVYLTSPKSSITCQHSFERMMKSSVVSSSQPRSLALGDLNNDHQIDIVVANSGTHTIGIFISQGNGIFAKQQTYQTGSQSCPYSVAVTDFNNDNYLDIAVANYGINNLGIFLGYGNGTFNAEIVLSLGSSRPLFLTTGDFNNDNRMDIVVVNYGTNNISILLGHGNGSFQNQTTYSTGYDSLPSSLAVADFNNDSYLDIAVANYGTNNIGIFLGCGNGTFINQQTCTTLLNSAPLSIAVGDINNDDNLDIVVCNNGTGNVGLFLGYGNGSFQTQITYSIGSKKSYPQYISVADLNQDNKLDIIVVDSQNNQIHILPGYGNGSFATITTYDAVPGSSPMCVGVADFNNNNQSDIVVTSYGTNNVLLLIGYSISLSARQTDYDIMSLYSTISVAVSDFNNDHILDIVYFTPSYIHVRNGLGDGTFGNEMMYLSGNRYAPQYICVGYVNNDNKTDIIAALMVSHTVAIMLGYGNGTFANMTTYSTGNGSSPWWVAVGDVNNDHRLDIVSANSGTNTVGILLGNGDGTFDTIITYSTGIGSSPKSVAIGDLNNDNYLDLAVVNGNNYVTIFLGHGDGSFIIWDVFPTVKSSTSFTIALGDFNRDTYLDIVVANTFTDNLGVFLGYGNGTFGTQTRYPTGSASQPYYVIVADFNNDKILDIAATNNGNNEVIMFYGVGNGSFNFHGTYPTGYGSKPYGIVVADLNNNKQLDMIVALSGTKNIAVLIEYHAAKFVDEKKYLTGSAPQPYSVAVGDLNNDNRSDIVVANSGTASLSILIGFNNGTFELETEYQLGIDFYPLSVIICDINKDDQSDIVDANSRVDSISVILRDGNGTSTKNMTYSTGNASQPVAVNAGDFNNDNRIDLIVANEGTNSLGIFFGFNYTIFQNQHIYSSNENLQPVDIAISDINNDSFLDIVATFQGSDTIGILLGYGNGSFTTTMITYSTGTDSKPWGIVMGDFNNDNRSDIVVTNLNANNIGIFLGYGNGSFSNMIPYSTGKNSLPRGVTIGDFNNDRQLDIVVANYGTSSVGVLFGYGNGSFSNVTIYSTGVGSGSWFVTVGDFNNDDNLDIAVANFDARNVGILLGYSNGTFGNQRVVSMAGSSRPTCLTVDDFNGDNKSDIAVADWNENNVVIFLGYGDGSFILIRPYPISVGSAPIYLDTGDFNNDNISDIAVVNYGTNSIAVLFGLGDGSFLLGTPYSSGLGSLPFALGIGDFNNDTRLDIAVVSYATSNIGVFISYDSQLFGTMISYTTGDGSMPCSVAVSDLNNDSYADIAVTYYGIDNLGILLGYGNGSFLPTIKYPTGNGSAPSSIAIAHFNNDTHLDIVVTNSQTNNILILLGYGNGTFRNGMYYSTGVRSRPSTVATGDLNNDNITDIAIANSGSNNILLLYGNGDGTFENEILYPLGYGYHPYAIALKDLNQDNRLDIVIACYDTDHVETFINKCL